MAQNRRNTRAGRTGSSHRYITRAEKRELGIPTTIYDAARSLNERRVAQGEESKPVRSILKEDDFRRNWSIWKDTSRDFRERVDAAEMWGWWEYDPELKQWRYVP